MSNRKTEKIAFKMHLNPGQAVEYKRRHDEIPDALTELLKNAGISDYSIFLDEETNILFGVLWRSDNHTMGELPASAVMQAWWEHMADIMKTGDGNVPLSADLKLVFHME